MLLKSKISEYQLSIDPVLNKEYNKARLGKFTASRIGCCMMPKGIGDTALAYIRSRIFEELNGISSEKDIDSEAIDWGLRYEPEALREFIKQKDIFINDAGKVPVRYQWLIFDKDPKFACTPDGVWIKQIYEKENDEELEVETIEIKCYQLQRHLKCVMCDTPAKIKSVDPDAFWQVIMQMDVCDALVGYLIYYYPNIEYGRLRIIQFRKVELREELKLFHTRKKEILAIYEREKEILLNIKN